MLNHAILLSASVISIAMIMNAVLYSRSVTLKEIKKQREEVADIISRREG